MPEPVSPRTKRNWRILGILLLVLIIPLSVYAGIADRGWPIPVDIVLMIGAAAAFTKAGTIK